MTADELKAGLADIAFRALDRFGIPCVLLGVFLWFGREGAMALHETLVKPVVKSHVEFLETTSETLAEICTVQKQQAAALDELADAQRQMMRQEPTYKTSIIVPETPPKN